MTQENKLLEMLQNDQELPENDVQENDEEQGESGDGEVKLSKEEHEKLLKKSEIADRSTHEAQLQNEAIKIYQDKSYFAKLYERSPKIAQQVADKFFDGVNAHETYKAIRQETGVITSPVLDESVIDERVERKLEERETKRTFERLIKENGIDVKSKQGKAFIEEYQDIVEGKNLDSEKVEKYFSKAMLVTKNLQKLKSDSELDVPMFSGRTAISKEKEKLFSNPKSIKESRFPKH